MRILTGEQLKTIRINLLHCDLYDLADRTGLSISTMHNIEEDNEIGSFKVYYTVVIVDMVCEMYNLENPLDNMLSNILIAVDKLDDARNELAKDIYL